MRGWGCGSSPAFFLIAALPSLTKQSSRHGKSRNSHYAHFDAKHQQNIVILLNFTGMDTKADMYEKDLFYVFTKKSQKENKRTIFEP